MIDVALLQCPKCGSSSYITPTAPAGDLVCRTCSGRIHVANGSIPEFAPPNSSDAGFDHRWRKHPAPQPTTDEQFVAKTGWKPEDLAGKVVLDGGCGIGRYCRYISAHGGSAVGVDISMTGLAAATENAPGADLIQADLAHLPLRSGVVDMALSIGVLHHLTVPKAGFMELARVVKPGGRLAVWVYSDPALGNAKTRLASEFLHEVTKACPPDALYRIIEKYAVRIRDTYHPEWGPLQQVIRPAYNPSDEQCISDMFDWHAPQYRWWHTAEEVQVWFKEAGFDVAWTGSFPVSVSGVKRAV